MPNASPIDFAATRRALVLAVAEATGLPSNKIIREQASGPVQPQPKLPFASFKYRTVGIRAGQDALSYAPDVGPTMYRFTGERGIAVDLMFHSADLDEAYGLALSWQFGLSEISVREILDAGKMVVWTVNDARDMTALFNTGYQARAFVECELWLSVEKVVDLGSIDAVSVTGKILYVDDTTALNVSTLVETEG